MFFTQLSLYIKIRKSQMTKEKSRLINCNSRIKPRTGKRNSHSLIMVCGPDKERFKEFSSQMPDFSLYYRSEGKNSTPSSKKVD